MILRYIMSVIVLLLCMNCGGGGGSSGNVCSASTVCSTHCGATAYSNDNGTNCYSDAACTASCNSDQTERLRITNSCSYDIWVEQQNMAAGTPQIVKLTPGNHYDYAIPETGQASTRLWPKTGCDVNGNNCTIGQSSDPCPSAGCPPPVDSKIEATWGCLLSDPSQCGTTAQGQQIGDTYWNMSAVDGYTLPFTAIVTGNTISDTSAQCVSSNCSALNFTECPTNEDLSKGEGGVVNPAYASVDLQVINNSNSMIGCYSPCKALNYPTYGGKHLDETSTEAIMYCCPTPPIDTNTCRTGPVVDTHYVSRIHSMCQSTVYSYAYDDTYGLRHCSPQSKVHVIFGPNCP